MRLKNMAGFVGLLVFLVSCDLPFSPGEEDEPLLQTEGEEFELREPSDGPPLIIPYRFTNRSGSRVYLLNCNGDVRPSMERREEGKWVLAYAPVRNMCLSAPVVIQPGEEYRDTVGIYRSEIKAPSNPPAEATEIDGTYRLKWGIAYSSYDGDGPPWGKELELRFRISNSFVIRAH